VIADSDNVKDVHKYFHHTYIVVPEVDAKKVWWLYDESPAGLTVKDPTTDELGYISFEGGFEYHIRSPLATRKQWFNYNGAAYFIERIPARMWRKGICSDNTALYRFNSDGLLSGAPLRPEYLNALLQHQPMEVFQWPDKDKNGGVAIDGGFAYCPIKAQLYYGNNVVGKMAKRTKELFVPKELQDILLPAALKELKVKYV
jgi:hypothetical protein